MDVTIRTVLGADGPRIMKCFETMQTHARIALSRHNILVVSVRPYGYTAKAKSYICCVAIKLANFRISKTVIFLFRFFRASWSQVSS